MTPADVRSLETPEDADRAVESSKTGLVVIYKHSPICHLSEMAIVEFDAFVRSNEAPVSLYQVDVIGARPASQRLEAVTGVRHESPQVLVLSEGSVVWHASHRRVRAEDLSAQIAALA
jgi:bacillithiol system protein YtxJ